MERTHSGFRSDEVPHFEFRLLPGDSAHSAEILKLREKSYGVRLTEASLRREIRDDLRSFHFAAFLNGTLVASIRACDGSQSSMALWFSGLTPFGRNAKVLELCRGAVDPDHHGHKLYARLMVMAIAWAQEHGYEQVSGLVRPDSIPERTLLRLGFRVAASDLAPVYSLRENPGVLRPMVLDLSQTNV